MADSVALAYCSGARQGSVAGNSVAISSRATFLAPQSLLLLLPSLQFSRNKHTNSPGMRGGDTAHRFHGTRSQPAHPFRQMYDAACNCPCWHVRVPAGVLQAHHVFLVSAANAIPENEEAAEVAVWIQKSTGTTQRFRRRTLARDLLLRAKRHIHKLLLRARAVTTSTILCGTVPRVV